MTLHTPVYVQPTVGDPSFPSGIPFSAQELRRNIQALLSVASPLNQSGVTGLDGQFAVTQHAAGANFSVDIAAGHAFVSGTDVANQSVYGCWNDGVVTVATPSPPATGTENHRLVLQIEDKFNNGVWTGYTANLNLLADTGGGTPAQPASSITLALIAISAGQASVLNANITDQRPLLAHLRAGVKATSTNYTTATMAPDPDLQVRLEASAVYELRCALIYSAAAATDVGVDFEFYGPAGASLAYAGFGDLVNGVTPAPIASNSIAAIGELHTQAGAGLIQGADFHGTVTMGGTAGTFGLQFREHTSGSTVTVAAGSSLACERIR